MEALNCESYWCCYAGYLPQGSSTMNVHNANHYSYCIDTNIHHQSNTSVTDVSAHPDVGNIVVVTCKCQLLSRDYNVDVSLADSISVLCTFDFIESLDTAHTYQVVFVHNPRGRSSGFYCMYQNEVDIICFHVCHDEDLGPFQVIDRKLVRDVFNQTLPVDLNVDLTPDQVFDDYKKDLWSHVNHSMDYTQYIETIVDNLCTFMDLQIHKADLQALDAPNDATDIALIRHSIAALLGDGIIKPSQVDHNAYIPSKTVGFLSHENIFFEFIGPDRPPVCIDSVERCIEITDIIRDTGVPNYKMARFPITSNLNVEA